MVLAIASKGVFLNMGWSFRKMLQCSNYQSKPSGVPIDFRLNPLLVVKAYCLHVRHGTCITSLWGWVGSGMARSELWPPKGPQPSRRVWATRVNIAARARPHNAVQIQNVID